MFGFTICFKLSCSENLRLDFGGQEVDWMAGWLGLAGRSSEFSIFDFKIIKKDKKTEAFFVFLVISIMILVICHSKQTKKHKVFLCF